MYTYMHTCPHTYLHACIEVGLKTLNGVRIFQFLSNVRNYSEDETKKFDGSSWRGIQKAKAAALKWLKAKQG